MNLDRDCFISPHSYYGSTTTTTHHLLLAAPVARLPQRSDEGRDLFDRQPVLFCLPLLSVVDPPTSVVIDSCIWQRFGFLLAAAVRG